MSLILFNRCRISRHLLRSFRLKSFSWEETRVTQFTTHSKAFVSRIPVLQISTLLLATGASLVFYEKILVKHIKAEEQKLDNDVHPDGKIDEIVCECIPSKGIEDSTFPWSELCKLLRPDWHYLALAVLSALGAALLNILIPIELGKLVNLFSNVSGDSAGAYLEHMKKHALCLMLCYVSQGICTFSYISLLSCVGEHLALRLRVTLFDRLVTQDIAFFDTRRTGELINRLGTDVSNFKSGFKQCISLGLRALTQTAGCAGALLFLSPSLTVLMVVFIPGIIGVGTFLASRLRLFSQEAQAQVSIASAVAEEALSNIRTVRSFAMEPSEKLAYQSQVESSAQANIKLGIGVGAFQGLSNVALNSIVLGTLYAGGILLSSSSITPGDLMSFLVATQTVQRSLAQLSQLFGTYIRSISAGIRVFEYILLPSSNPVCGGKTIPSDCLSGDLTFEDVCFSYPSRPDDIVLQNLCIHMPAGTQVALVGHSGNGKSTVAALLERFYEPTSGAIRLDGVPLSHLNPSWLRRNVIGFIDQEPILFATSIMENIRYGKPDSTDEEVIEMARLANADGFIKSFPNGYNTQVGEKGVALSGGQKQRVAIARALLKNPSILILDEATSALDSESERLVQEALDRVVGGRTVIIIAHRLSTIRGADNILVMAKGRVAESGTHDELCQRRGLYYKLTRQQELEESIETVGMYDALSRFVGA